MRFDSLTGSPLRFEPYPEKKDWPELRTLCWMMLEMTARWDDWAHLAGMARRTFMRAFRAQAGMSFGRWRQQARCFAALEMLAQSKICHGGRYRSPATTV